MLPRVKPFYKHFTRAYVTESGERVATASAVISSACSPRKAVPPGIAVPYSASTSSGSGRRCPRGVSSERNSLPSSPSTRGAQVFWNRQEGAEELASSIQEALNGAVNAGHEKKAAQVPSSVYLMKEITAPGVLVECGFLSNAAETEQLKDPAYQTKLAAAIAAGVLNSDKR